MGIGVMVEPAAALASPLLARAFRLRMYWSS
jgi:hypothetical protein